MDANTLNLTDLSPEQVQQLEDEIQEQLKNILSQSNLKQLLKRYIISGEEAIKIQCHIDPTQIKFNSAIAVEEYNTQPIARTSGCNRTCTCWSEVEQDFVSCCC